MKKLIASAVLGMTLAGGVAATPASADTISAPRCQDTVVRAFYQLENVRNAPRTRRVISTRVLKHVKADRTWSPHWRRCVIRRTYVEPVYRDTFGDGTFRKHLILAGPYQPWNWRYGPALPYWHR